MIDYELYTLIPIACYTFLELEFNWWFDFVELFSETIQKPLGKCIQCFTGQIALWAFILIKLKEYINGSTATFAHLPNLLLSIFYAIFVSMLIQKAMSWLEK